MATTNGLIQIGEFARRAGTNLRTLRYWEELGLLVPASRSDGGFRYYDTEQLDRIAAIQRLQQLGLPLREIRELMAPATTEPGIDTIARVQQALAKQAALHEERIVAMEHDLADLRGSLRKLREMCSRCEVAFCLDRCDPCVHDNQRMAAILRALLV